MRNPEYRHLQLIVESKIEGGFRTDQMSLRHIREWTGLRNVRDLFQVITDRQPYENAIANIQKSSGQTAEEEATANTGHMVPI